MKISILFDLFELTVYTCFFLTFQWTDIVISEEAYLSSQTLSLVVVGVRYV